MNEYVSIPSSVFPSLQHMLWYRTHRRKRPPRLPLHWQLSENAFDRRAWQTVQSLLHHKMKPHDWYIDLHLKEADDTI